MDRESPGASLQKWGDRVREMVCNGPVSSDLTIDELRALARALPLSEFREQVGPFVLIRKLGEGDAPLSEVSGKATVKLRAEEIMAKAMLVAFDQSETMVATLAPASPEGELTVGRHSGCGFVVRDRSVSKRHAALRWDDANSCGELRDLGSTNGTFINAGRLVGATARVQDGDVVSFGDLSYTFQLSESFHANVARRFRRRATHESDSPPSSRPSAEAPRTGVSRQTAIGMVAVRRAPFRMVPCKEPMPEHTESSPSPEDELDTIPPPMKEP